MKKISIQLFINSLVLIWGFQKKVGDYKVAKECYYMVYDLANDYTVKKIIDGI